MKEKLIDQVILTALVKKGVCQVPQFAQLRSFVVVPGISARLLFNSDTTVSIELFTLGQPVAIMCVRLSHYSDSDVMRISFFVKESDSVSLFILNSVVVVMYQHLLQLVEQGYLACAPGEEFLSEEDASEAEQDLFFAVVSSSETFQKAYGEIEQIESGHFYAFQFFILALLSRKLAKQELKRVRKRSNRNFRRRIRKLIKQGARDCVRENSLKGKAGIEITYSRGEQR